MNNLSVILIHGFNSAPDHNSKKALAIKKILGVDPIQPYMEYEKDISTQVSEIINQCVQLAISGKKVLIIGTSLGGGVSYIISKLYGFKALLLNPMVDPTRLESKIGKWTNYKNGNTYEFTQDSADDIVRLFKVADGYDSNKTEVLACLGYHDDVLPYEYQKSQMVLNGINYASFDDDHRFNDQFSNVLENKIFKDFINSVKE